MSNYHGNHSNQGEAAGVQESKTAPAHLVGGQAPQHQTLRHQPSVGRFENDQVASLYIKGSSAGLQATGGAMATHSNHGVHCQDAPPQASNTGIVDLRAAEAKLIEASKKKWR